MERPAAVHQDIGATLRQMGILDDAGINAERAVDLARKPAHRYLEGHATPAVAQLEINSSQLAGAAQRLEAADAIASALGDDTAAFQAAI